MPTSKCFPAITGSCFCNSIRYRLLSSPLYCYACHCADCQKSTGSAFALLLSIETSNVRVLSEIPPVAIHRESKPGLFDRHVECPTCKTELWSHNVFGTAIADVRVGTLDLPSLMEPDLHIFVESKIDWVILPDGAKSTPRDFKPKEMWPQSSLKRLDACLQKIEESKEEELPRVLATTAEMKKGSSLAIQSTKIEAEPEQNSGEGDKTPTGVEADEGDFEDDAVFDKRVDDMETALLERLEKLCMKLEIAETKDIEIKNRIE